MTSSRSSSNKSANQRTAFSRSPLQLQKRTLRRRMWPAALTLFVLLMSLVAVPLTELTRTQHETMNLATLQQSLTSTALEHFGLYSSVYVAVLLLALLLGIQGFAWLDSTQKLDFYMSQPMTNRRRFFTIYLNGIFIFLISYAFSLVIGLAGAAAAFHAVNGEVVRLAFAEFVRCIILFLGVYHIAILAVLLTGNLVCALLGSAVLLLLEPAILTGVEGCCSTFFKTYIMRSLTPMLSAIFNYTVPLHLGMSGPFMTSSYFVQQADQSGETLARCVPCDVRSLIVAAVLLVLILAAWHFRKNEMAGSSVVFAPVRAGLRIVLGTLAGCYAILLFFSDFATSDGAYLIFAMIGGIFFAILTAVLLEMIFTADLRAGFRHIIWALLPAVCTVFVFCFFRFDLSGYDTWLPDTEAVASSAICSGNDSYYSDSEDNYAVSHMMLTDTGSVRKIAEDGIRNAKQNNAEDGSPIQIYYRLKNGKTAVRSYLIPYSADPAPLDAVLSSDAYKQGAYPIVNGDDLDAKNTSAVLSYDTASGSIASNTHLYSAFREAYLKDLATYNYTLARDGQVIGDVSISFEADGIYQDTGSNYLTCPVYDTYENTLAFLKANNLYLPSKPNPSSLSSIQVTYSSDLDTDKSIDVPNPSYTVEFTDPEDIRRIMEAAVSSSYQETWSDPDKYETAYTIDCNVNLEQSEAAASSSYYIGTFSFPRGGVPDFVKDKLDYSESLS